MLWAEAHKWKPPPIKGHLQEQLPFHNETDVQINPALPSKEKKCVQDRQKYSFPKILLANVRSLGNKIEELEITLTQNHVDVACLCETWSASDSCTVVSGYDVYLLPRLDKDGYIVSHGGGVGVLCNSKIPSRALSIPVPRKPEHEVLWLWTRPRYLPKEVSSIIFGVVYYPPRASFRKELVLYLQHSVDYIRSEFPYAGIQIMGDFNDLKTNWLSSSLSLKQVVKVPTREKKALDLIFTNTEEFYSPPYTLPAIGMSDHLTVIWEPNRKPPNRSKSVVKYRPRTQEQIQIYREWLIRKNWSKVLAMKSGNDMMQEVATQLFHEYQEVFPEKTILVKSQSKPWVTKEMKNLIKMRNELYKSGYREEAKKMRNVICLKVKKSKKEFGAQVVNKLWKSNPSRFHQKVQEIMGQNRKQTTIYGVDGEPLSANQINLHFANICRTHPPLAELPVNGPVEEIPIIRPQAVCEKLKRLDTRKSNYPLEIPIELIATCSEELGPILAACFNQCLIDGAFPDCFKTAYITPIPKVNKPLTPNDLRPISKTPCLSKVFEGFIYEYLFEDIEANLDPRQFGFRPEHNTTHYLVSLIDDLMRHLEKDEAYAEVLISDIVKAFDSINHRVAINRAKEMGARQFLLRMVASFLHKRRQCVALTDKEVSEFAEIWCGAPQGTKLGPLLFLIVFNSVLAESQSRYKFADDLSSISFRTSARVAEEITISSIFSKLKHDLQDVMLTVSETKSHVLQVSFLKSAIPPQDDIGLDIKDQIKILGVTFKSNLKWDTHVESILQKAAVCLKSFACLTRFNIDVSIMRGLYCMYVRSQTEYACPAWHPGLAAVLTEKLEDIQKRACKIILGANYISYDDSLQKLRLQKLAERRHDLTMRFGKQCLQSEAHRKILPDFQEARSSGPSTRRRILTSTCQLLCPPPRKSSKRYLSSFVPYFVGHFNDESIRKTLDV